MYGKVFASMYDGTLCTKGPWQALVTFQQLIVLADKEGIVDMTPEAISRRTTIPLDVLKVGLTALAQPDLESRSPAEDGRRIVPMSAGRSWGWSIVNYGHYRAMRTADERREYMRRYMRDYRKPHVSNVNDVSASQPIAVSIGSKQEAKKQPRPKIGLVDGVEFSQFWKAYPKKTGKGAARKAWGKLNGHCPPIAEVLTSLEAQKTSIQWLKEDGRYIPNPATWINQERWSDEVRPREEVPLGGNPF